MSTITLAERNDREALEMGDTLALKPGPNGLVPVVTTCADTGTVLMQAWTDLEALAHTLETGEAHYYSRSRQELWHKGATSGEIQEIVEVRVDCDQDSLWFIVRQQGGGCCHVGFQRCFYRTVTVGEPIGPDGKVTLHITDTKGKG